MTSKYFHQLNYTMANEDTNLEYEMVKELGSKNLLSVGGSGSRCLPFLGLPITSLKIADVSSLQLTLIAFKLETIRQLSREDAVAFWHGEDEEKREKVFEKLSLSSEFKEFYRAQQQLNAGIPPLYWGKWEKTFRTFSKIPAIFYPEKVRRELFYTEDPYGYFQQHIQGWKWTFILKLIGNKAIFNSILYKGDFIKKNIPLSYYDFYSQAYDRLFRLNIKESHFLQICFFGKVLREEALPIEFREDVFHQIKASTVTPTYHQGSIFEATNTISFDFISLSDVPSYLSGDIEKNYLQLLKNKLATEGVIVNRHYLRVPEDSDLSDYQDVTAKFSNLTAKELVQMYHLQVLRKS